MQYLPSTFFAVPFIHPLKRNLEADRMIAIYGYVLPGADRFMLNLQTGPNQGDDIALHLSFRFPEGLVVLNTLRGGNWESEERHHSLPVAHGQYFQMLIYVKHNKFKIAFNGVHFADFHHRMPLEAVAFVGAEGQVQINNVNGVRLPNEPDDVVYSPENPFVHHVGSIFPGRLIRIRGTIPHDVYRFTVNLMDGPDVESNNIPFHASVRPNAGEFLVELNSQRHGGWDSGHQIKPCPVRPGQAFEMLVLVDHDNYKIAFNGQHFAEFAHRQPLESVNYFRIDGSVHINKVSFEGHRRDSGFDFTPMPPPSEDYFHPFAYEAVGNHHVYANPYPLW